MELRAAVPSDIPEIVQVLKASLGEEELPLTEEIWKFKHLHNPFGESLVLIAEEEGTIVGVRAFMKWEWQVGNKIFNSFRAVDTATHPDHQGKGIFKKLTLKAVEIASENGNSFIFNTPNDKSRPGYIKMGWRPVGKLNVSIVPVFPFGNSSEKESLYHTFQANSDKELDQLCAEWNKTSRDKKKIFTPKSRDFLKWRYEENPLQEYEVVSTPEFYLAFYIKRRRRGIKEFRIVECFLRNKQKHREIKKIIRKLARNYKANFISIGPEQFNYLFSYTGKIGPILTVRNLSSVHNEVEDVTKLRYWNYSLGDLELF